MLSRRVSVVRPSLFSTRRWVFIILLICRPSRPRSWFSVLNARSARPRPRDLLRDARLLKSVKRRTRMLSFIKHSILSNPYRMWICLSFTCLLKQSFLYPKLFKEIICLEWPSDNKNVISNTSLMISSQQELPPRPLRYHHLTSYLNPS